MANQVKSDDEILEFAIAREVEANHFFIALAKRVDSPHIRKVFEELAEEELEHKAKLELELMKTGKVVPDEIEQKNVEEDLLFSGERLIDMDYKDVLLLGIEKEEASFRTYVNLVHSVYDADSREILLALAEEEVKHKIRFETEYDLLLKEKD